VLDTTFLVQLMEVTPTAANAAEYATLVHEAAIRRAVRDAAQGMIDRAMDETVQTADLLSGALEQMQRINVGSVTALASSEDAASEFLTYLDELERGEAAAVVPTGFQRLDKLLGGGMIQSGLYILAARPGVGKTTVGLKVADKVAASMPVLFVSLEMDLPQLTARRLADRTGIRIGKILLEGCVTEDERAKLAAATAEIAATRLFVNRASGASVEEISLFARSIPNLGLIVVDYLGLITNKDRGSLYEKITANSNALKRLARSLKIPVLCLAQLNRQSEQRPDKTPSMADLRDSGAIEQDADAVILLHRPAIYLPQEQKPKPWEAEPLEIIVSKNRHGQTGRVTMNFYGTNGRISD
jgi:replicative DNA helicase